MGQPVAVHTVEAAMVRQRVDIGVGGEAAGKVAEVTVKVVVVRMSEVKLKAVEMVAETTAKGVAEATVRVKVAEARVAVAKRVADEHK